MKIDSEDYKIATSIWLLSCNDKVPQMTYRGITERIDNTKIESIKRIVLKFPELYQTEIPQKHLHSWKEKMHNKTFRPKWIAKSTNQKDIIEKLSVDDVFRNRFRNSINAQPLDTETINWGLSYLREIFSIKENASQKRLLKASSFWIPLISLLIAGSSILFSYKVSYRNIELEKYKVERNQIQKSYTSFLVSLNKIRFNEKTDAKYLIQEFANLHTALMELNPYLESNDINRLEKEILEYFMEIEKIVKSEKIIEDNLQLELENYYKVRQDFINATKEKLNIENY